MAWAEFDCDFSNGNNAAEDSKMSSEGNSASDFDAACGKYGIEGGSDPLGGRGLKAWRGPLVERETGRAKSSDDWSVGPTFSDRSWSDGRLDLMVVCLAGVASYST